MKRTSVRIAVGVLSVIVGIAIAGQLLGSPLSPTDLRFILGCAVIVWAVLVIREEIVAVRRELVDVNGHIVMLYKKMAEPEKFFVLSHEYQDKYYPDQFFVEEDELSPKEWAERMKTLRERFQGTNRTP